ncbi:hypothetical protein ACXYMX_09745 [Sporosarcina sp. CAU 1771]
MERFDCKHLLRDARIPEHRQTIKEAIEKDLADDMHIIAVFYGGSIGNEDTDVYSDIDLRIVVRNEAFEEYRDNKKKRAEKWGEVLFFEDLPYVNYSTAHYDNFVKVNTFYYRLKDLLPSASLRNIEVFYDESEMLEDIVKKSNQMQLKFTKEDVELWRTKFFAYLHELYRRVMRNELYYGLRYLDNLRFSIVTAWYMEAGMQPNPFGDWAKVEGERSHLKNDQLELLKSWSCSRDPVEIMDVTQRIIPEFKRVHRILCEQVRLEENADWVDEVLNKVL